MKPETLNDIFSTIVERDLERVMLQREGSQWIPISAKELQSYVLGMAGALRRWGVGKGDRVAILSENRPEWTIGDFACLQLGAVVVPIYATLTAQQVAYILSDSSAKVVVVSTESQLQKVLSTRKQTCVERVVVMDGVETADATSMKELMREVSEECARQVETIAKTIASEDLASIIYTSGTTGVAKGVKLTHGNLTSNIKCSLSGFDIGPWQTSISFLPLSHVTARHADFALLNRGVTLAYCPFIEKLPEVLLEVRPQLLVAVPRVYEKLYSQVQKNTRGFTKNAIYRWALAVGRVHETEILAGKTPSSLKWKLADKLVYSKVRAKLGGNVEIFVSGGAPLGYELAEWFAAMGMRIHEGYGLTETSPVIALNSPVSHKIGTVGRPLANVEVRIASDSEILVRGPSVFRAYWNKPRETTEAFENGWFKTGDIGKVDEEGFLTVTDRKKDLIKTSGGKFIAPQPIENSLKLNTLVGTAVVLGDRRKFPSVIISPHFPALEEWARTNQVLSHSREELVANPRVKALYDGIVEQVNARLARHEMLKKVLLVPHEFTASDGSLTPTMKVRRKIIEERYSHQIAEMYEERAMAAAGGR
jgi:long-chain acyl-CoA synthetase